MIWYKDQSDIVISTRVRLARNIDGIPFPDALKNKDEAIAKIKNAIFNSNSTLSEDFTDVKLEEMVGIEKQKLAEKHLISSLMLIFLIIW